THRRLAFRHHIGAGCVTSEAVNRRNMSSSLRALAGTPSTLCSCWLQSFTTSPSSFACASRSASRVVFVTPARFFGNAPSRIRPVEAPHEHAWRQGERESSASVVIVIMFMVPLWLYVLSAHGQEQKRAAVRAWALEHRAAHRNTEDEGDDKA
ncbi:hypothetical protein MNV84_03918, partial [Leishmania braziliensis]